MTWRARRSPSPPCAMGTHWRRADDENPTLRGVTAVARFTVPVARVGLGDGSLRPLHPADGAFTVRPARLPASYWVLSSPT